MTQVLCEKEQADLEAGARVCSLLLAQSEIRSQCLLLVLANSTGKGHVWGSGRAEQRLKDGECGSLSAVA